jgi:hypothetical protein
MVSLVMWALVCLTPASATALRPTAPVGIMSPLRTRRAFFSTAAIGTFFASARSAQGYGIQGRPARDFSGVPKADGDTAVDPTLVAADRTREARDSARKAQSNSARFGVQQEPPQNKAQEKLAKAREQARARAQQR